MKTRNEQRTTNETVKPAYYIGHDDITLLFGKFQNTKRVYFDFDKQITFDDWNSMKKEEKEFLKNHGAKCREYDKRTFTQSFHSNPEDALCYAALGVDANKVELRKKFLEEVEYDHTANCYIWNEFLTRDGHPALTKHMSKFGAGEYELYVIEHELSVMKTELVKLA